MSFSTGPRGRFYIRSLCTQIGGGASPELANSFAAARWGAEGLAISKAAVAALTSGDIGTPEATEYLNAVRERSVLGGLLGTRPVAFNRRMLARTNGAIGFWVGEAAPAPMLKAVLAGSTLKAKKVVALIAVTDEGMRAESPAVEAGLQADLETGCAGAIDQAFLDPSNAGSDTMPASVTHGAPIIAASSDAAADLKALVAAFAGDLSTSYLITDPSTATALAMVRGANGSFLFPDAGPRGGSVLGIPLLVSRHSPRDTAGGMLALVDASGIALAMDSIEISQSDQTSLAMADTPTSPATMVSLFQTGTTAMKAVIRCNFENQRVGGVAVLTGVDY
ncbi:phage major capsid protein [Rhodanobacter sp. FDAARGOS 1247]|uniref:phage major capsid protein n=1 Tax=Rhodanobacter sp. FDAARGOS 1247 TaxID=2778082 RepID=UPI00194FA6BC|nr:phage major capsid protein [Rhodanobacter sp. FDAARGOS 1247]QRP62702.1 phage major capsid protein [Rhodanobacter sp. FDAARGOS 1247]